MVGGKEEFAVELCFLIPVNTSRRSLHVLFSYAVTLFVTGFVVNVRNI